MSGIGKDDSEKWLRQKDEDERAAIDAHLADKVAAGLAERAAATKPPTLNQELNEIHQEYVREKMRAQITERRAAGLPGVWASLMSGKRQAPWELHGTMFDSMAEAMEWADTVVDCRRYPHVKLVDITTGSVANVGVKDGYMDAWGFDPDAHDAV